MIKKIRTVLSDLYLTFIRYLSGTLGNRLRYLYYKKKFKYLGENVIIDTGVFISGMEYISINNGTHIDKNCIIVASEPDLDLSNRYVKKRENARYNGRYGEVFIGKDCHISQNTMIFGYGGVYIGNNTVTSADSKIYSLTSMAYNPYDRTEIVSIVPYSGKSPTLMGSVVLEDNVWLGIGCIVSPGITLGENCFVKSYTILNTSFEDNSYIGGEPASKIRNRYG